MASSSNNRLLTIILVVDVDGVLFRSFSRKIASFKLKGQARITYLFNQMPTRCDAKKLHGMLFTHINVRAKLGSNLSVHLYMCMCTYYMCVSN